MQLIGVLHNRGNVVARFRTEIRELSERTANS